MSVVPFIKGIALGFSVSAPFGPIGLLCVQRTVRDGFRAGWSVGLGATTADALFATVAALGLQSAASVLDPVKPALQLLAAGLLGWLAVRAFRSPAPTPAGPLAAPSVWRGWLIGFTLLATNPAGILLFSAVFAGFGVAVSGRADLWAVVAGVVVGAQLWWIALNGLAHGVRDRIGPRVIRAFNRGAAALLAGLAVVAASGAFG